MIHTQRLSQQLVIPLSKVRINLDEQFPTLKTAPSIEAVIHWVAPAGKKLEFEALRAELIKRLPDYPSLQTQQGMEIAATGAPDGSSEVRHRTQWNGFRLQNEENRYVAQFLPNGLVFSRLEPYEKWESFTAEALRLWQIYMELAEPKVIQRLGVRHINQILLENGEQPSTYLKMELYPLPGLNIAPENFFYKDTYQVPGYPYSIHWVRTLQPSQTAQSNQQALIVDIDVFRTQLLRLDQETLTQRLQEMRWLKNNLFFSSITKTALQRFGVDS